MTSETRSSTRADELARYYDRNTRRFLALGGGGQSHAIHRALWGPGVTDAAAATGYINVLIGDAIDSLLAAADFTLLDLGCGVGGTLFALARRFPLADLHGVTISAHQAALARGFADDLDSGARCTIHCGDFESIHLGIAADMVVAVESMVHASSVTAFFDSVSRHLSDDGVLVVVDDFITSDEASAGPARNILDKFRRGWRLSSLSTIGSFIAQARAAGFELAESRDLTPMIRLQRPRDRMIAALSPLVRPLVNAPLFGNLVGGAALTRGLRTGVLAYHWLSFRR